jgi:hypothetical protein
MELTDTITTVRLLARHMPDADRELVETFCDLCAKLRTSRDQWQARAEQAEKDVALRDAVLRRHAEASACFQVGGDLADRANLLLGDSTVVDGIAWLRAELAKAERERDEARAKLAENAEITGALSRNALAKHDRIAALEADQYTTKAALDDSMRIIATLSEERRALEAHVRELRWKLGERGGLSAGERAESLALVPDETTGGHK